MMSNWKEIFEFYSEDRNRQYVTQGLASRMEGLTMTLEHREKQRWDRIEKELGERKVRVLHANSRYKVKNVIEESPMVKVFYEAHVIWDLEHHHLQYKQEWVENRLCLLKENHGWWVLSDELVETEEHEEPHYPPQSDVDFEVRNPNERRAQYDRHKAVQYAERWWNDYNPQFKKFEVDCTSFVSQCMWAGQAPMKHSSDRGKGWWYKFEHVNWSYSWAVANSLRWYLPNSRSGLRATEAFSADQLEPGDVICYDFNGDGRWQHNTVVVTRDAAGMPLVNAHTTNSRQRYWSYTDSHAWTDKIQYKFLKIVNRF